MGTTSFFFRNASKKDKNLAGIRVVSKWSTHFVPKFSVREKFEPPLDPPPLIIQQFLYYPAQDKADYFVFAFDSLEDSVSVLFSFFGQENRRREGKRSSRKKTISEKE